MNAEKFQSLIEPCPTTGCMIWTGAVSSHGYGNAYYEGRQRRAHRLSYELSVGPIPDGMQVLHRCDVPSCVAPHHLFLGIDLDNHRDKTRKGRHPSSTKTHCKNGHEYTPENTYIDVRRGWRQCRVCANLAYRRTLQ